MAEYKLRQMGVFGDFVCIFARDKRKYLCSYMVLNCESPAEPPRAKPQARFEAGQAQQFELWQIKSEWIRTN